MIVIFFKTFFNNNYSLLQFISFNLLSGGCKIVIMASIMFMFSVFTYITFSIGQGLKYSDSKGNVRCIIFVFIFINEINEVLANI